MVIGQSLGNVTIDMMSIHHSGLFSGIVFSEFDLGPASIRPRACNPIYIPPNFAKRRDKSPSRQAARILLAKSPYYDTFDSRVFDKVIEYELFDVPPNPPVDAERPLNPVTLTVPETIESYTWMRPDPLVARSADSEVVPGFYRGEVAQVYKSLPYLLRHVLYIWGTLSPISFP